MTVNEYLKLPYHIISTYDAESDLYITEVQELPGCLSQSPAGSVIYWIKKCMYSWIETALERGLEIPLPKE